MKIKNRIFVAVLSLFVGINLYSMDQEEMVNRLCHYASFGNITKVMAAVNYGALVNGVNRFGQTPLIAACRNGKIEVAAFLLAQGADLNAVDYAGNTALIQAVKNGNCQLVDLLLSSGAYVDHINNEDQTAWSIALEQDNQDMIQTLYRRERSVSDPSFVGLD